MSINELLDANIQCESNTTEDSKENSITIQELLDIWYQEELAAGPLSNDTVMVYKNIINLIKKTPLSCKKVCEVSSEYLQDYMNTLCGLGVEGRGTYSYGYLKLYRTVLVSAMRFALYPMKLIDHNPMQYVRVHYNDTKAEMFGMVYKERSHTITHSQFLTIVEYLKKKENAALLPIQIAYYTGMRLGEVCGLLWRDINLDERSIVVRRSMKYNASRHKLVLEPPKQKKVRVVDFGDTLAEILREELKRQTVLKDEDNQYTNYYNQIIEGNRVYYDVICSKDPDSVPDDYEELDFVCIRKDGKYEAPDTVSIMCRSIRRIDSSLEDFHYHMLRHSYTCNLLEAGAKPKEVQELLGHSNVATTLNIYAHISHKERQEAAKLLDRLDEHELII